MKKDISDVWGRVYYPLNTSKKVKPFMKVNEIVYIKGNVVKVLLFLPDDGSINLLLCLSLSIYLTMKIKNLQIKTLQLMTYQCKNSEG